MNSRIASQKRSTKMLKDEKDHSPSPPIFHANKEQLYSSHFNYAQKTLRGSSNKIEMSRSRNKHQFMDYNEEQDINRQISKESMHRNQAKQTESPTTEFNFKFKKPIKKIFIEDFKAETQRDSTVSPKLNSQSMMKKKHHQFINEPMFEAYSSRGAGGRAQRQSCIPQSVFTQTVEEPDNRQFP